MKLYLRRSIGQSILSAVCYPEAALLTADCCPSPQELSTLPDTASFTFVTPLDGQAPPRWRHFVPTGNILIDAKHEASATC